MTRHMALVGLLAGMLATSATAVAHEAPAAEAQSPDAPSITEDLPVADEDTVARAGYDGGFFIESADKDFLLKLKGRGQVRYALAGGRGTQRRTAFTAERVRIDLSGHALSDNIRYKLQSDFGKGFVTLKDLIIDYGLPGGVWIRAGQFKRPFSRQQITSSGGQELVDRAITDRFFGAGRDVGVAVHNNYTASPKLEWIAGVFNGTGDRPILSGEVAIDPNDGDGRVTGGSFSSVPRHLAPAVVGRLGYNHGGIRGYSEADLEGGPLRFAVATSVLAEFDTGGDGQSGVRSELDYAIKASGLSSTGGVYVSTAQDGARMANQSFDALGFHLQAGYVVAKRYGVAARYAHILPRGEARADQQELSAAFSLYEFSHNFKWQTDVSALSGNGGDLGDNLRLRTQVQLSF